MNERNSDLEKKVFPAEQTEIKKRRENLGLGAKKIGGDPSVNQGLAGLALSGGGIRSATFSLGVIQGLAKLGILKRIDYLSTVSGGGYIGSCLSVLLNNPDNRPDGENFPLRYTAGSEEPPALTHLRNSSNYLSPAGLLSRLRLPNLLLRGVLLNLFVFLPFIMAAVFITEVIYTKGPHWDDLPLLVMPLVVLFIVFAIAFPFAIRILRNLFDWRLRNAYELWLTIPLLLAMLVLAVMPILNLTRLAIEHRTFQLFDWFGNLEPGTIWQVSVAFFAVLIVFMFAGRASENVSKLSGKLVLLVVGLMGPTIIFSIYLLLCLWQINSPFIPLGSSQVLNAAVDCSEPCLAAGAGAEDAPQVKLRTTGLVQHLTDAVFLPESVPDTYASLTAALVGRKIKFHEDAVVTCLSAPKFPCDAPPPRKWRDDKRVWVVNDGRNFNSRLLNVCPAPGHMESLPPPESVGFVGEPLLDTLEDWVNQNCTYFSRGSKHSLRIEGAKLDLFESRRDWIFLGVFLLLLAFNRYFLDINITSPHGFYRDRLSRAYLFGVKRGEEIRQYDKLKLTELNAQGSSAPYHLINVALNLQGSNDPKLRGRMCDFFIFSKHFTGSERTGYTPTRAMELYDKHLDLGTAMAISGAAAAPNMGVTTNRSLVFIMTLLNIRLGYWLPNPRNVRRKYWHKRLSLGSAKPTLIWKESLGHLTADGSYVNVSDGGHIENLGIYPLLKRRCKFIVAVDGEADPDMTFGGLVTLMRFSRIDMGIEIEIDLEGIRKNKKGYSKEHWSLGTIRYGDGEVGHLLYIKLSVTGDEPEYVRAYRAKNTDYPHESTADQFFTEDQFEAYRALGEHICDGMLDDIEKLGGFKNLSSVNK